VLWAFPCIPLFDLLGERHVRRRDKLVQAHGVLV
jgi:hypothetical protein